MYDDLWWDFKHLLWNRFLGIGSGSPNSPRWKEVWFILEGGLHVAFWLHDCRFYKLPSKTADVSNAAHGLRSFKMKIQKGCQMIQKVIHLILLRRFSGRIMVWLPTKRMLSTFNTIVTCVLRWRAIGCPHSASIPRHTWHRGGIYLQKLQVLKRTMVFSQGTRK